MRAMILMVIVPTLGCGATLMHALVGELEGLDMNYCMGSHTHNLTIAAI